MTTHEEQHRQRLEEVGERRPQQPAVVAARPRRRGAELKIFLASISASERVISKGYFTYEEQHRRHLAVAEGRHRQQLEEEGRVLLRAGVEERRRQHLAVEALPLCSSHRRRREAEEEGLQPGVVAGRLLLLGALAAVVVHQRRRQEVCKGQSRLYTGPSRQPATTGSVLTVAVVRQRRQREVWSMLVDFSRGLGSSEDTEYGTGQISRWWRCCGLRWSKSQFVSLDVYLERTLPRERDLRRRSSGGAWRWWRRTRSI